jgi:uncharacterized protein (DUF2147 family)
MRPFGRHGFARASLLVFLSFGPANARAQDAEGFWMRDDGAWKIQFAPCGAALCGAIVWLRSPKSKAHIGQQVFAAMVRADQNSWTGQAFIPEDGRTYPGRMVVSGKKLRTSGCVFGGLICRTTNWVRAN